MTKTDADLSTHPYDVGFPAQPSIVNLRCGLGFPANETFTQFPCIISMWPPFLLAWAAHRPLIIPSGLAACRQKEIEATGL